MTRLLARICGFISDVLLVISCWFTAVEFNLLTRAQQKDSY